MRTDLRKSGIEIVGDVPWGTHFCQFYQSKEDLLEILLPYFKEGLENNEFCMWITAEPLGVEDAKKALREKVKDLDDYIKKGQIEILDYSQWYTKTGRFDADTVIKGWIEKEKQAIEKGFDGLRLTGNTFWLKKNDWQDFADYEAAVNSVIRKHRMLATCSYSLDKCRASEVIEVVDNHQFALIRKEDKWLFLESSERKRAEEALRKSEARFRSYFDMPLHGIAITSPDKGWIQVNDQICSILGYTREEIVRMTWTEMTHPDDLAADLEQFNRVLSGQIEQYKMDKRFIRKDGKVVWMRIAVGCVRKADGKVDYIVAVGDDITERKRAEKALRESEERYRRITEGLTDYLYTVRVQDGRAVETVHGPACETVTGYTAEEFASDPYLWLRMIVAEERDQVIERVRRVLAGERTPSIEHRIVRKDGQIRWVSDTPILHVDSQGKLVSYDGVIKDITERKRAEEALRVSEERFRTLVQNLYDMIFILKPDGTIVYETPSAAKILGYGPEGLIGRNVFEFIHPDDLETVQFDYQEVVDNTNPDTPTELRARRADGTWIILEVLGTNLVNHPGINGIIITARDITERKRAEEEKLEMERHLFHAQKLESLGVLAGGIAHDFNNLLMAILGNLDLAQMELSPVSPAQMHIQEAHKAGLRAADLTRQMLAYSGKGRFVIKPLNLSELVEELSHLLHTSISKTAALNLHLHRSLPKIFADPTQIQQIIMNLIINASEAIGERVGSISIATGVQDCDEVYLRESRLEEKPPAGRFVYLEVSDTGCGMDEPTQQKLFEPFFTTKFQGRGLGMSAVLGIVRGHKGAIKVYSEPDKGTTIKVLFPALESNAVDNIEEPTVISSDKTPLLSPTGLILIVDDEEMVRDLCKSMVEHLGFRVLTAIDGEDAVAVMREHAEKIACVILDLTMPKMDGVATFRELRRVRPEIQVILSSGYNLQDVIQRFAGKGLAGFIQKPYQLDTLRNELRRVLNPL